MKTRHSKTRRAMTLVALLAASPWPALATNGMLMEGYGPVATGMGGASAAVAQGVAAAANNPATLGLLPQGTTLNLALGHLGPRVSSAAGPVTADSEGRSYTMPALGIARQDGRLAYGLAVFAQGGMGTDYSGSSFLALGSGAPVRSELGVGRVMLPVAWKANEAVTVGGSLDLVWGSLDLRMAATGAQLGQLVSGAGGNLAMALPQLGGAPWARIDFSDTGRFTGAAKATGWAAKLGVVLTPSPTVRLGLTAHSKTRLGDLETGATGASLSAPGGFADRGRMVVEDFQMPSSWTAGLAWQARPDTLVALDIKRVHWSGVMGQFRMRYESAGMGGQVSFALPQQWQDQTVLQLGLAHTLAQGITLRAGVNHSSNPIPQAHTNPLFPAIVRTHWTLGAGVPVGQNASVDAALTLAPTVRVMAGSGVAVSHKQQNLQLMWTQRF